MNRNVEDIQAVIYQSLYEMLGEAVAITPDTNLLQQWLDSVNFVRLIVLLEEAFDVMISDEDVLLEYFETVESITGLVTRYVTGA